MRSGFRFSVITGYFLFLTVVPHLFQLVCHGQNVTQPSAVYNDSNSEIDFETLSLFGITHEFAEEFRLNLLKAIEAAKDEVDPLRQGQFGGGAGAAGGGGGGNQEEEDDYEDVSEGPTTPGPGAFGVLSGLFGIFSGLGTLNPSRIIQSTVNFFPPGRRMQAQMIVDSLIGYTPPENRTVRPRPRTRRPITSPMTITEAMMKEVTAASSMTNPSETKPEGLISKGSENDGGSMTSANGAVDSAAMSEVIAAAPEPTTTEGLINVHKLLARSTTPPPVQNEDDESDFEKRFHTTVRPTPKSNSSMAAYKITLKSPEDSDIETRGVVDEDEQVSTLTSLNITTTKSPSSASVPAAI